ncbi:hypothetical protein [Nocardioides sp. Root151]|uniref:hypothetical protein n=1 Tax=Nocardioides sp. Root151 TaxID=1736475 RepID=UPI0007134E82|nr:hypothetical protein [Nocardioides sp. Root151]KQZ70728.1 hypothetical protein ASD66_14230 [Nocardioides sp. Root151]
MLIATTAVGATWLMVFLDSLEDRVVDGDGYAPVAVGITPIALGCATVLVLLGAGTTLLVQARSRVAATAALLTGVATLLTAPVWRLLEDDGKGFVWLPLSVGILEVVVAGWLVLRSGAADPPVRPLRSLVSAGLLAVTGLVCVGISVFLLVTIVTSAQEFDVVGTFHEDESQMYYMPIGIAFAVVFGTCGVAVLGTLARRWPRRVASTDLSGLSGLHESWESRR